MLTTLMFTTDLTSQSITIEWPIWLFFRVNEVNSVVVSRDLTSSDGPRLGSEPASGQPSEKQGLQWVASQDVV